MRQPHFTLRPLALAALLAASLLHAAQAQQAPQAPVALTIAAQPLGPALNELARQANLQLLFAPALVAGKTAPAVSGTLTPHQALEQLLAGSGLTATQQGSAIVVKAAPSEGAESTLSQVTVTAQADRNAVSEGTGSYAVRAATLFQAPQSLREIPQSISVLTRQQMDDQNLTSVDAAMEQVAGVTNTGLASEPVFWSRGYRLGAQIDGTQSTANNGRYATSLPALAMYDRIEVLRGVSGLLRGNGEPGGVINYVKKRPLYDPATSVRMQAGSWNHYYTELDVSHPLNAEGTLRGRAVLAYQDEDKFYDVATDRAKLAYGVLEYDLTPDTILGLSASYSRRDFTPFWGLPYYSDGSLPSRSSFVGYDHQMHTEQKDLGINLEHRFDSGWRLKTGYTQVKVDRAYLIAYGTSAIDSTTGLGNYLAGNDRYDATDKAFNLNLAGPVQLWGRTHKLTAGYDRQETDTTMGARWKAGTGWDMLHNHDFSAVIPADGNQTRYRTVRSGFYANANLHLAQDWTVILGGRWSDYTTKSRGVTIPSNWNVSLARANKEFTPFGGVLWDISKDITLYGSYAEIFEPQSDIDYTGQVLKPRTGWQTELGAKGEFLDGRLNASLALFRIRDQNRTILDTNPAHMSCGSSGTSACSLAAGQWQSQGLELEVAGRVAPGWDISGSYTRTRTKVLRAATPDLEGQVANVTTPEHLFKLWTQYRPGATVLDGALDGWSFGTGIYASSRYSFSASSPFQGGYATVSAKAGYRINRQWDASLLIGNLFDRRYLERAGSVASYSLYGKPRNFTLALQGKF